MNSNSKPNVLLVIIILVVSTSNFVGAIKEQENLDNNWHPFALQHCDDNFKEIYNGGKDNEDVTVTIIIQNVTDFILMIQSEKKIGERSYYLETKIIETPGTHEFSFSTTNIQLRIDTSLNDETYHQINARGQYRINNGETIDFNLQRCYPQSLTIFHSSGFYHFLKIDLNVTNLINNTLYIENSYSDAVMVEDINEVGFYTYNFNASYLSLSINYDGYASGYFRMGSSGSAPIPAMIGFYFSPLVLLCLISSILILRKKRRNL